MASLKIRLDDRCTGRGQWRLAMLNAGIWFTTMICGRSLCQLPGDADRIIVRHKKLSDMRVTYPWASERILGGLYSAVAMSKIRNVSPNVYLEEGDEDAISLMVTMRGVIHQTTNTGNASVHFWWRYTT
ncbi:hypothetical protein JG688_00009504 [Phytophthora aleatoria]|uniref:Uncharacterized protein n=1 Tax=Phytophthora aleatoria TaxID=2496075 RepID=A0A8J5IL92_9STRA|nr:hypothetical protein JG688_00009504 [Phytophthora aleatoria]